MTLGKLIRLCAAAAAVAAFAGAGRPDSTSQPASVPASPLQEWLGQNEPTTMAGGVEAPAVNPLGRANGVGRGDALPGVVVLSDGQVLAGALHTTRDRSWEVWEESQKRWRHVPPIAVLSIRAVVVEESMDSEWRWKEMGSDEKLLTGRTRPIRRLDWQFHLIDGSHLTGTVKGQPLWVESGGKRFGPYVLHERSAGQYGQKLEDLVYVKYAVISRAAMERVLRPQGPASRPG